jgi:hypothetical protein
MRIRKTNQILKTACIASSGKDSAFAKYFASVVNSVQDQGIHCDVINDVNVSHDIKKPYDFYFIINILHRELAEVISPKLVLSVPTLRCQGCSKQMSGEEYVAYRLRFEPSKCCGHISERRANYMHVFYGDMLRKSNGKYIDVQLRSRFWASVDADWRRYKNLVQAITMIPHYAIAEDLKPWAPKMPLSISYLGADQETRKKLQGTAKLNKIKINTDPKQMLHTWALVHSLSPAIPDRTALNAMAAGMPVFGNISKFYLSHYPVLPILPINSCSAVDVLTAQKIESAGKSESIANGQEYVKRLFNEKRIGMQWNHLIRFILNPNSKIDEVNQDHLPLYWGLQGGYAKR